MYINQKPQGHDDAYLMVMVAIVKKTQLIKP